MSEKTITHEQLDAEASCWDATSFRSQQLRRAAFTIRALTAEVERLRGDEALAVLLAAKYREAVARDDKLAALCWMNAIARLPTPAPEATDG